jgi:hypothetical protein
MELGCFAAERRKRWGQGRPAAFDFPGFRPLGAKTKSGVFTVRRKTIATRLRQKLQEVKHP